MAVKQQLLIQSAQLYLWLKLLIPLVQLLSISPIVNTPLIPHPRKMTQSQEKPTLDKPLEELLKLSQFQQW